MPYPNLSFPLPRNIESLLEMAEAAEPWVITADSFLHKQRALFVRLPEAGTSLMREEFLRRFVMVSAYSSFRDSLALLNALGMSNPDLFATIVNRTSAAGFPPSPQESWGVIRWRIRYLTAFSILSRVFAEDRIRMIVNALRAS